jgi:hypothetical protein
VITPELVSTIIPVKNRPQLVAEAVRSVLAQTYRPIEILVVDDGSTDETCSVVEELAGQFPEVRLLHNTGPVHGPGPSREVGRVAAQGEYLQYLDSDDLLEPGKFAQQVAALRSRPECDIAYGRTCLIDEDDRVLVETLRWTGRPVERLFPRLLVDRWWCTHTPLYRRSLTDAIGPWPQLKWSQDWLYDARAGARGVRLAFCDVPVSRHRRHTGVRQTQFADWDTDPVRLTSRTELLEGLWTAATAAEVSRDDPTCLHFARWAFSTARRCGAARLLPQARTCLALAVAASEGSPATRRQLQVYRLATRLAGQQSTARWALWLERFRGPSGRDTLSLLTDDKVHD